MRKVVMYTKYTHRRALSASLARISAVALLALAGASPMLPAHAGPDDGRIITTQGHVDAPKTYWENGGFALKNEANPYKTGADLYDLDKTVNWVGKGWDGRNGASQYTLTLTDSPNLRFLGEPRADPLHGAHPDLGQSRSHLGRAGFIRQNPY